MGILIITIWDHFILDLNSFMKASLNIYFKSH